MPFNVALQSDGSKNLIADCKKYSKSEKDCDWVKAWGEPFDESKAYNSDGDIRGEGWSVTINSYICATIIGSHDKSWAVNEELTGNAACQACMPGTKCSQPGSVLPFCAGAANDGSKT